MGQCYGLLACDGTYDLIKSQDTDNVLLLLRNDKTPKWSLVSGGLESDEDPMECLKREIQEELSIDPSVIKMKKIGVENIEEKNMTFHYYEGLTSNEFKPKLDKEFKLMGNFNLSPILAFMLKLVLASKSNPPLLLALSGKVGLSTL